jgi:hypothetical protein
VSWQTLVPQKGLGSFLPHVVFSLLPDLLNALLRDVLTKHHVVELELVVVVGDVVFCFDSSNLTEHAHWVFAVVELNDGFVIFSQFLAAQALFDLL